MKPAALSAFPIFLLLAAAANSQDVGSAIDVFASRCLVEGPRFDKTVAMAKQEEWPTLAADMAMAFTPVGEPTAIEGWMASKGEENPFQALVVYKAEIAGKSVEGCTVALSGTDAAAFDKALVLKSKAKPLGEETGEDTVYKRYSADVAGREGAITIALPRYPKGSDQVVASVVAEQLVDN
ncbi:hypothetical protein EPK99_06755 [Neorhizobium lilium]|uniref:Uncharacterized protein n=1 Tax=Neorhizobium lilium TaxID=2503024 RepID=A0A3S3VJX0_9HYPH|nr:hypothetical protein [Neorhizobium lilium]RWX78320.1 hypothetical protein EPK99_06755 [Neorhizobium lilium]